jgi:hypothetical protein
MSRIGITGHRGLPTETASIIDKAIRKAIDEHLADGHLVGVSSLADGADAIFARAVLDRGGELEVIVPAEEYRAGLPADHHKTYDELFEAATKVERLPFVESTSDAHMAASERMLDMVDELFAVWDGLPARGHGGTADVVNEARRRLIPITILWPEGASRD